MAINVYRFIVISSATYLCIPMARPQLIAEKKRSVNFTIRLTAAEQKELEAAAAVCGTSPAALIREKVFTGNFPKPKMASIDMAAYLELKKIGVNLNQLTRLAHVGKMNQQLVDLLVQLWKQQKIIIAQLLAHDRDTKDR